MKRWTVPLRLSCGYNEGRILCWGPKPPAVRAALHPWHEVHEPASFALWKHHRDQRNPWRAKLSPDDAIAAALRSETGIEIADATDAWIARAAPKAQVQTCVLLADDGAIRERIAGLARREFADWTTLPFVLEMASLSPLITLNAGDDLHVIVDLGAGNVLDLRARSWSTERPAPLVQMGDNEWDGGDVHLWIKSYGDSRLEGSAHPARERRRRSYLDDDRDDDD